MPATVQINEETLLDIVQSLSRIETSQNNMKTELLGNGQPGRIQRIETNVDRHEKDLGSLNKTKWIAIGALVVVGHALEAAGKYVLIKLGLLPA